MDYNLIENAFSFLKNATAAERVRHQQHAAELLLEKYNLSAQSIESLASDSHYKNLKDLLEARTQIFAVNPVQKEIYNSDSGTAFVPERMKKTLLN